MRISHQNSCAINDPRSSARLLNYLVETECERNRQENDGDWAEAIATAETGRFGLILMDVQMPEMDGLEGD